MVKFYNALLVISAFLPGMVRGQHEVSIIRTSIIAIPPRGKI